MFQIGDIIIKDSIIGEVINISNNFLVVNFISNNVGEFDKNFVSIEECKPASNVGKLVYYAFCNNSEDFLDIMDNLKVFEYISEDELNMYVFLNYIIQNKNSKLFFSFFNHTKSKINGNYGTQRFTGLFLESIKFSLYDVVNYFINNIYLDLSSNQFIALKLLGCDKRYSEIKLLFSIYEEDFTNLKNVNPSLYNDIKQILVTEKIENF